MLGLSTPVAEHPMLSGPRLCSGNGACRSREQSAWQEQGYPALPRWVPSQAGRWRVGAPWDGPCEPWSFRPTRTRTPRCSGTLGGYLLLSLQMHRNSKQSLKNAGKRLKREKRKVPDAHGVAGARGCSADSLCTWLQPQAGAFSVCHSSIPGGCDHFDLSRATQPPRYTGAF